MTIALIDADIVAYRCAASAEKDSVEIACIRANRLLQDIVLTTDASEYKLFLSGSSNWRKELYPEYKANRDHLPRPVHLQSVREFLVLEWAAQVCDGYEADDALGMEAGRDRIICSIDKDLKQVPGMHYNFVTGGFEEIDERTGWLNFYTQLVLGDRGDNVPGFDGKMRLKWPQFLSKIRAELAQATTAGQMYSAVKGVYALPIEELTRNGRLLYIWREEGKHWEPPQTQVATTSEVKLGPEVKSESIVTTQEETSPSMEHGGTRQKNDGFPVHGDSKDTSKGRKPRVASTSTSKASSSSGKKKGKRKGNTK